MVARQGKGYGFIDEAAADRQRPSNPVNFQAKY